MWVNLDEDLGELWAEYGGSEERLFLAYEKDSSRRRKASLEWKKFNGGYTLTHSSKRIYRLPKSARLPPRYMFSSQWMRERKKRQRRREKELAKLK